MNFCYLFLLKNQPNSIELSIESLSQSLILVLRWHRIGKLCFDTASTSIATKFAPSRMESINYPDSQETWIIRRSSSFPASCCWVLEHNETNRMQSAKVLPLPEWSHCCLFNLIWNLFTLPVTWNLILDYYKWFRK